MTIIAIISSTGQPIRTLIFYANDCIRITSECRQRQQCDGYRQLPDRRDAVIDAGNAGSGTFSNISITNNYLGFVYMAHAFYPGPMSGVTASNNVIFDYTNSAYSTNAWAVLRGGRAPDAEPHRLDRRLHHQARTETGPTTLYGSSRADLYGGSNENNFVGGYGRQLTLRRTAAPISLPISRPPIRRLSAPDLSSSISTPPRTSSISVISTPM